MEDQNQNMIPDGLDRLVLRILAAAGVVLPGVAAALKLNGGQVPLWLLLAAGVPAALAGIFSFKASGATS